LILDWFPSLGLNPGGGSTPLYPGGGATDLGGTKPGGADTVLEAEAGEAGILNP